ncbi:MAG: methyl-accepting chemotaxis protein [Gemmatimonadaceae bacterium]
MNLRPSTRLLSSLVLEPAQHTAQSLRRRLIVFAGVAAAILVGGVAATGLYALKLSMGNDADARVANAASLSKELIERVLAERERQVELVASEPTVIQAAQKGAVQAIALGLPQQLGNSMQPSVLDGIEARFKAKRSLQVDEPTIGYLTKLAPKLDIAEVMVTDRFGYNAVTTSLSSDFVQSDEDWWQTAWTTGKTRASATADPATQRTVVELASAILDGGTKVGVVKVKFGLSVVDSVLSAGSDRNATRVDLVDSTGRIIASSVPGVRFKPFSGFAEILAHDSASALVFSADSTKQRGAVAFTNGHSWRVIAHMRDSDAMRAYNVARWSFIGGVAVMLVLLLISLGLVARFIERRITNPAQELAILAEAVAAGDLSKQITSDAGNDEIGRLSRAIGAMIAELRRLALALNESTHETGMLTAEITAGSEEMSASAGEIAHTASDLSQQANVMAGTIQSLTTLSGQLVDVASRLDRGAHEEVARNETLRSLALENRSRLDSSSQSLATLVTDVEANAAAIDGLAQASEEVRTFVTLVQKLARQSKLLALNAAMEAARAGEHGHGFAVVAEEVRRLSAMSSDAAERTERVVRGVLNGIAQTRAASSRSVDTVRAVRGATEEGSRSFGEIEKTVAQADAWTSSIESAVTAANGLTQEMSTKLESLSVGTESFAAAMEEVAASSQEQSASTEQIAAAAATLSDAADRLTKLVANLRLEEFQRDETADAPQPRQASKPIPLGARVVAAAAARRAADETRKKSA